MSKIGILNLQGCKPQTTHSENIGFLNLKTTGELCFLDETTLSKRVFLPHSQNGNDETSKMFTCSCPDFKFNSKNKNIVCKHICFLICKVAKILKPYFYETKILNDDDFNALITKLTSENIWTDSAITKNIEKITMELFTQFTKPIADSCPICFNDLTENDKHIILSCPCCKNYVHTECIEVWMEKKMECVFCRSDCWDKYVSIK